MANTNRSYPNNPDTVALTKAILSLQSPAEARQFLRDLLTEPEILELSARLKAAQLLDEGVRYVDVQKQTGLSSATVARVASWLQTGLGGYRIVLDRLNHLSRIGDRAKTDHHESSAFQEAVS